MGAIISLSVVIITVLVIELINLSLRFGMKLKSRDSHKLIMKFLGLKKMIHFHHLYLGIIFYIIAFSIENNLLASLGIGIAISDLAHHIFLYLINGDSEFNILYKSQLPTSHPEISNKSLSS